VSYCINPLCQDRENEESAELCVSCGNALQIHQRFRLTRLIQQSHLGAEVFEAIDEKGSRLWPSGARVILKTLYTADPKQIEMFKRQIRYLKFFNHPGIPRCDLRDDFVLQIQRPSIQIRCLAMSRIEGAPLDDWLAIHGHVDQLRAVTWLQQLAEIIHLIHSENLFHRDIKPSNIIVKPNLELGLVDFGAVRKFDTPTYRIKATAIHDESRYPDENGITALVSPGYTPPEQANGRATPQSDFFSLGRTIIYALTAIRPSNLQDSTGNLLWEKEAPQVDRAFANLLNYLIHPNWLKRPRNSQDLLLEVEHVSQHLKKKLNRQQFLQSKLFILSIISGSILLFYMLHGFGNLSRWLISRFYFGWAHVEESVSEFEQSKQKYQAGLSWYPDVASYIDFGQSCQLNQDYDCALDSYNKALKMDSKNWPIYANLGGLYDDLQQYNKASEAYQKAINLAPNFAVEAINNQSRIQIILGNSPEAIRLANHGLALLSDATDKPGLRDEIKASLFKNIGWGYFIQGEYERAYDALEQSKILNNHKAATHCLLAQVKEKLGERKSAESNWLNCFQIPSSLPEVKAWQTKQIQIYMKATVSDRVQ
jgi:serine/threonine protein kinase